MTEHDKAHLQHEVWVGGISNMVFNGLIAWLLLRGGSALAWGGQSSFAVDVVATAFLLPLIVALIVIPLQKSKLSKGKLQAIDLSANPSLAGLVDRFPRRTWTRALVFGLIGMCIIAPLTLLGFWLVGVEQVQPVNYAIFKGVWAGLMAAILVVPMVLCALTPETN